MWDKKAKLWRKIREELEAAYIIVEGKKDVEALRSIGIEAHKLSDETLREANGVVVILTDMDREGERLAKAIAERLKENVNVERVDVRTRSVLAGLLNLTHMEEIEGKLRKFEEEVIKHGENIH